MQFLSSAVINRKQCVRGNGVHRMFFLHHIFVPSVLCKLNPKILKRNFQLKPRFLPALTASYSAPRPVSAADCAWMSLLCEPFCCPVQRFLGPVGVGVLACTFFIEKLLN